jgi:hypothetical protein
MISQDLVSVVLLNYNGHDDTRQCLLSLAEATYPRLDVIVCDNASTRPGLEALEADFPAARFIRNRTNLGFAAGCNVGIAAARDAGASHVILLNNDTIVLPGFVEPLVEAIRRHPDAGIAGGTVLQLGDGPAGRTDAIWYAGASLSKLRGEIGRSAFGKKFEPDPQAGEAVTGFVSGCFALIPIRVLDTVGWLDEDFFFGVEDLDFAWRLEERGFRSLYVPASVVWHRSGRSRALTSQEVYRAYAAKLLLQRKHRRAAAYRVWLAAYYLYMRLYGLRAAAARLERQGYGGTADAHEAAVRQALRDAWRGRLNTRAGISA